MADSRPVPCNLLSWPRVLGLLPDQKLIIFYLWANRFTAACGCYQFPISMAAHELGLSEGAFEEALRDFVSRELILLDQKTSEILVLDWFRFHKFSSSMQIRQLDFAIKKIESESLKNAVLQKIKALHVNKNGNINSNKSFSKKIQEVGQTEMRDIKPARPEQLSKVFEKWPQLQGCIT